MNVCLDPYAAQHRLIWHNRWRAWRRQPGEAVFHALALLAAVALAAWLLVASTSALASFGRWLLEQPLLAAALWVVVLAGEHYLQRRRQQARWASDWFAAQPVSRASRARRRRREALLGSLPTLGAAAALLALADAPSLAWLLAMVLLPAVLLGQTLADRVDQRAQRTTARRRARSLRGRGRLWRWQWQAARGVLAPRPLAGCLLALLLVPRGPASMLAVGVLLVTAVAWLRGWQRALGVLPAAEAWLREQPLRPRDWLPSALWLPLALLAAALLPPAFALPLSPAPAAFAAALALLAALAVLQLACTAAGRRQPRRLPLRFALHALLLLAVLQVAPPLALLGWLLQLGLLGRQALRQ